LNTSRRGNEAERFVAKHLEEKGWVVASRRHIGGAGDLLAVHPNGACWLVEVKARKNLYSGFTRADREAMKETKLPKGAVRFVVNKRGKDLEWVSELSWP
jgi:Holliday junction resolvase-like predicted endonuclease